MNNLIKRYSLGRISVERGIILLILVLGLAFRCFHFFSNRSLWTDEFYLCSGLLHMDYVNLATNVMDYQQKAPIGFLWTVKSFIKVWGNSESILRIFPLLCGIASLFLYLKVCHFFLKSRTGKLAAIFLLACAPGLIYHSVEIKQYSTECLATILSLYLYIVYKDRWKWSDRFIWGISGAITIWFSFPVIFILAGIAISIFYNYLQNKELSFFYKNLLPISMWCCSFLLNYIFFTHKHIDSDWIVYWFKAYDNFLPFPPKTIDELKWYPQNLVKMMDYPLGFVWNFSSEPHTFVAKLLSKPFIPSGLLFWGIYCYFKTNLKYLILLGSPVLLMCMASAMFLYPLLERFWVFIAPIFILFIACGFEYLATQIKSRVAVQLLCFSLLICPFTQSTYFLWHPEKFYKDKNSQEKEALLFINNNFKPGDAVYNYWNNKPGYKVYKNMLKLKYNAIQGHDFRRDSRNLEDYNNCLKKDFTQLTIKKRGWIIFHTKVLSNIGDLVDDPKWYYQGKNTPAQNIINEISKFRSPYKIFPFSDVTICLIEFESNIPNKR